MTAPSITIAATVVSHATPEEFALRMLRDHACECARWARLLADIPERAFPVSQADRLIADVKYYTKAEEKARAANG